MHSFKKSLFILCFPLFCFSQFKIEGELLDPESKENLEINLSIRGNVEQQLPVIISGNRFYLESELVEPINAMLQINNAGKSKALKLLLDNSSTYEVEIVLENEALYFNDKWYKIETQSPYYLVWRQFYDVQGELYAEKRTILNRFEASEISKEKLDQELADLELKINQAFKNLALTHSDNYVTPYILTGAPDFGIKYQPYYDTLSTEVQNSYWGLELKARLSELEDQVATTSNEGITVLGTAFGGLKGKTQDGSLKEYTSANLNSKLTLIDFWASWCGPCRIENTELSILNKNYKSSEFQIISFSLDTNQQRWEKASKKDRISWENLSDLKGVQSVVMKDFQIKELPRNLLVNAKGQIIATDKFGTNLKEFVENYLKTNP